MTASKKFKARVRARSAKTGEAYVVARRRLLEAAPDAATSAATTATTPTGAYRLRGGLHPPTATLANVLAHHRSTIPGTGEPMSEAFVLGVSGGLGAGYILWQWQEHDRRVVTIGFLNNWQYPGRWVRTACDRLGVSAAVHETGGAKAAATALAEALDDGRPAIAEVSAAELPYWHLPKVESGWWGYPVVVYGRDGDAFLVDDRNRAALHVPSADLVAARGRIGSYKNRLVVVEPRPPDEGRLVSAVRDGIAEQVAHLSAKSDSFSLPAFRKWARLLTDTKAAKGWPVVFADGRGLLSCLASTYEALTPVGILGGNLRDLYAEFLDLAGDLTALPLAEAAAAYRAAAQAWNDLAKTILAAPTVAAVIDANRERREAVLHGDAGAADAAAAAARSQRAMQEGPPIDRQARDDLFSAMAAGVRTAHDAEKAALRTMAALVSGPSGS